MQLTRFTTAAEFRDQAEAFLVTREAEHNVLLGLTTSLTFKPDLYPSQPYFAVIKAGETVVAAAVMTPPHNLVLSYQPPPEALRLLAEDVRAFQPDVPGVVGAAPGSRQFAEVWQALTGRGFRVNIAERLYRLDAVRAPAGISGQMRRVAEADRSLLLAWVAAFQVAAFGEAEAATVARTVHNMLTLPPEIRSTFVWEDPYPVTLVSCGGPTPNSLRIGPVYTPVEFRRKGYASALTAAVSQYILDSGRRFCTLYTDLQNPTSNKIYQNVGYRPVCDVDEYRFE